MFVLWIFFVNFFFVVSIKSGVGVISFSTVFQEHVMRNSVHFIAKRKKKRCFGRVGRVKGRTHGAVFLQKRVWWGKNVSISLKFISEHYLFILPLYNSE